MLYSVLCCAMLCCAVLCCDKLCRMSTFRIETSEVSIQRISKRSTLEADIHQNVDVLSFLRLYVSYVMSNSADVAGVTLVVSTPHPDKMSSMHLSMVTRTSPAVVKSNVMPT